MVTTFRLNSTHNCHTNTIYFIELINLFRLKTRTHTYARTICSLLCPDFVKYMTVDENSNRKNNNNSSNNNKTLEAWPPSYHRSLCKGLCCIVLLLIMFISLCCVICYHVCINILIFDCSGFGCVINVFGQYRSFIIAFDVIICITDHHKSLINSEVNKILPS